MSAAENSGGGSALKDRWWVDVGDKKRERAPAAASPVGSRFYRSAKGFEQDAARARLTDLNQQLLAAGDPGPGAWGYVQLADKPHNAQNRARITAQVSLPPYARGVVVDCGRTLRLLVTGTPPGERVLDLTLGDVPSFDAWVEREWVLERVFRDQRSALTALRRYVAELLSPDAIAAAQALRAQV
jgi:hypothetical protein